MAKHKHIQQLAHVTVRDRDYNVYVSINTQNHCLHVFKYNDRACAYEIFTSEERAESWIEQPLPTSWPYYS